MKVTFTCPTCDYKLETTVPDDEWSGTFRTVPVPPHSCLGKRLTYGPLTEDLLAEALEEVDMAADDFSGYRQMACFVLRLLKQVEHVNRAAALFSPPRWFGDGDSGSRMYGKTVRDWLLDLAREGDK